MVISYIRLDTADGPSFGEPAWTRCPQVPDYRPLYQQVRDLLRRRIVDGTWRPDEVLPSEGRLAAELGVSQGTVRKALDEMAAQKLVVRRQGRGTFVAAHSPDTTLFHFFHLVDRTATARCRRASCSTAAEESPARRKPKPCS